MVLVDILLFAVPLLFVGLAMAATQLVAAWAALSDRPAPRRILIPAATFIVAVWLFDRVPYPRVTLAMLLGLEMLKVAVVLLVAKRFAAGPLRFSLGEIMLATAVVAGILGIATLPALRSELPDAQQLAIGGMVSALTLGTLWTVLSRSMPAKLRWLILVLCLVLGGQLLAALIDPTAAITGSDQLWVLSAVLTLTLAWHAFLVGLVSWLWYKAYYDYPYKLPAEAFSLDPPNSGA